MRVRRFVQRHWLPRSGFTIIELMIVIAVMSVLMLLAVAAYGDYSKRTRVIEVMLAANSCKMRVFEAYYYGSAPAPGTWGCEAATGTSTTYVDSIEVDPNGKVIVVARGFNDDQIDGKAFTLTPMIDGAPADFSDAPAKGLQWRCGSAADGTTIGPQFLPATCRNP